MLYRLCAGDGIILFVIARCGNTLIYACGHSRTLKKNCNESLVWFSSGAAYQRLHWDHQKGRKHFTIFAGGDQDEMSKFRNSGRVLLWHEKYSRSMFAMKFKIVTSRSFDSFTLLVWGIAMWDVFPKCITVEPNIASGLRIQTSVA